MTIWLLLDRLHVAEWVWGAVAVVMVLVWICTLYRMFTTNDVDIFDDKELALLEKLNALEKAIKQRSDA